MDRFLNQTKTPKHNSVKTEQGTFSSDILSLRPKQVEQVISRPISYSCDLAFTITLKPSEYRRTYEDQYKGSCYLLTSIFNAGGCKYTMVAELTKQYNIHYHGIIKIPTERGKDSIKWFFDRLRLLSFIGRSECEQVKNYEKWTTYIMKDVDRDIDVLTVIKDDYNLHIIELKCTESVIESGASI